MPVNRRLPLAAILVALQSLEITMDIKTEERPSERLIADLHQTIASLEAYARDEGAQALDGAAAQAGALRGQADTLMREAQERLAQAQARIRARAAAAAAEALQGTREKISDHPWQAVGVSAVAGMLVGLLIGRR